jgi:hypothetical protein
MAALGTDFGMMSSMVTDEAMTSSEEQIRVMLRQAGKGVEGDTINNWSGEAGTLIVKATLLT